MTPLSKYGINNSDMNSIRKKSVLMEAVQTLILLENEPDYKVAAKCGVSPTTILNIRHGNHFPNVLMAEHIYEMLSGYDLTDFDL